MGIERKPPPPLGERLNRKGVDRKHPGWDRQEELTAEAIPGGKRVVGSGSSRKASRKSDVSGEWVRAEDKTTSDAKSISVKREFLDKIKHEAHTNGQVPAFVLGFDYNPKHGPRQDWLAFPATDAARMMSVVDAILQGDIEEAQELARRLAPKAYRKT